MTPDPAERMDVDEAHDDSRAASEGESGPEVRADLMVVSRARRSNAGNRMSTLLAKAAEEEEWGEEWEEAPNEEEFVGDDANDQDDFNLESSSSEEEDEGGDDDAGEKELRKAERQERSKKRKTATNPFAARLAAASRKRVKLDVPTPTHSPSPLASRPKKKSERASWIPTEEDGPTRTSSRRQTVANKESTLAKLKEKDRRRDDTLAMMKAAEARKAKDEPKPLTQEERLAEAARVERMNSKSLHRWEQLEEQRAAERQAKLDALKNRQIDGPFIRFYSGPAIWVDDKLKYTGKDAPKIEYLEEKINKELHKDPSASTSQPTQSEGTTLAAPDNAEQLPSLTDQSQTSQGPPLTSVTPSQPSQTMVQEVPGQLEDASASSHTMPCPNSIMFAPPANGDSFLFGIEQYAQPHQQQSQLPSESQQPTESQQAPLQYGSYSTPSAEFPQNPFLSTSQSPFSQPHPSLSDPLLSQHPQPPHSLLAQFQRPPAPPAPPRRKLIRRALRNLLILSSFPNLEATGPTRAKTAAGAIKEKDRSALIQLSTALFGWSQSDASAFVTTMLNAPKTKRDKDAALKGKKELCAITNNIARYRDPETGIAYHDARAFGVLRGVVGGGFVWCGELGCYVGGRAKPLENSESKGFLGMKPCNGVPKRFLEMPKPVQPVSEPATEGQKADATPVLSAVGDGKASQAVKTEPVVIS